VTTSITGPAACRPETIRSGTRPHKLEPEIDDSGSAVQLKHAAVLRTTRMLFDGHVLVPQAPKARAQAAAA